MVSVLGIAFDPRMVSEEGKREEGRKNKWEARVKESIVTSEKGSRG